RSTLDGRRGRGTLQECGHPRTVVFLVKARRLHRRRFRIAYCFEGALDFRDRDFGADQWWSRTLVESTNTIDRFVDTCGPDGRRSGMKRGGPGVGGSHGERLLQGCFVVEMHFRRTVSDMFGV